ncbi:MAG TPA: uracil-DNA glycosylase family protein [Mycobacteriales bacterium]|nr:uracil-DNA glycosylase family protein [Mycobacteriales bacterium]
MGAEVLTLADLIPRSPKAVVVGINPAPPSVAVGHYYQGTQGRRLMKRLLQAGLFSCPPGEWHDDAACGAGIGFTDVVKRPTRGSSEVTSGEFDFGRDELRRKLEEANAPFVIFAFKEAAKRLFGPFEGNGQIPRLTIGKTKVFVMPGPYEAAATAERRLAELQQLLA